MRYYLLTESVRYNSTITGKGTLLPESKMVFGEIASGKSPSEVRDAIIHEDMVDRTTHHTREKVWKEVYRRYISGRDTEHIKSSAHFVSYCRNPNAVDLVLFYEYCQIDPLLFDLTSDCTYSLYQGARTTIDNLDVSEWLSKKEELHPEIAAWSAKTRNRLIGSFLSTIRDFAQK